jgi:hypothetical protein
MLSPQFSVIAATVKEILVRDLSLQKFTRRWLPHGLSDPQKMTRIEASNEPLQILNDLEADFFDGMTTGDKSWFHYLYKSWVTFAKSPGDVIPRTRKEIGVERTMFTLFFTNRKFLIADHLPNGQNDNQDYFISDILPELEREKMGYQRKKQGEAFYGHMDHSKVTVVAKSRKIRSERPRTLSSATLFS